MMRSVRLQLLVTLAATAVAAGSFVHRGLPPDRDVWHAVANRDLSQLGRVARWQPRIATRGRVGITPIQCLMGSPSPEAREVVAFLFRHGVFAEEDRAVPPLCNAAKRGLEKMVALLIDCGADVNIRDKDGRSPLHYALTRGHDDVADLLRSHGATE